MGQEFNTEVLTRFVSDLYGESVFVGFGNSGNMSQGTLGLCNCYRIVLRSSLTWNRNSALPYVFFHELGHLLLHKRDSIGEMTQEEREKEAGIFANEMLRRFGGEFVWSALRGNLSHDLQRRAKIEIMAYADSSIFKRNQMKAQPYHRTHLTFHDQEMLRQSGKRQSTVQPRQMTATALQAQGRRELALAAKVNNPDVAAMIRQSAQEKLGTAPATNGRLEKATLYR